MLLPVYTIVALINIFAKINNFNFRPPKNLPYEIRVRRDLVNAANSENVDIKDERVNVLQFYENLKPKILEFNEEIPIENTKYVNAFRSNFTDVESKSNNYNIVPVVDNLENKEIETSNNRRTENDTSKEKSIKTSESDKFSKNENHDLVPEDNNSQHHIQKSLRKAKAIKLHQDQRRKKCKSVTDCFKRPMMKTNLLNENIADKRTKRNFGSYGYSQENGYNGYNRNFNNDPAQNNMYNYHVTQKSTLDTAFKWMKNLVNTHEKYVITNYSAPYPANNMNNAPVRKNITITSNYNWNYLNNTHNLYKSTLGYNGNTGYNYNNQYHPYNGYNNYQNNNSAIQNFYTTPAVVIPNGYYGIKKYNYSNQEYPNDRYSNHTTGNIYNGLYPKSNRTEFNSTSYTGNKFNNTYSSISGTGFNSTVYYDTGMSTNDGYNPFPVYNETESLDSNSTTEDSIVVEGCILCGSFGCPLHTKRVGFRCIPIKK